MSRKTVRVRLDARISDDTQIMVRFNNDADVSNALSLALATAHHYRVVPGYTSTGAITVSRCSWWPGTVEARTLTAGVGQHLFGLATVGRVRAAGMEVIGTDVTDDDGNPLPFTDRHADVIVLAYPGDVAAYAELSRAERRTLRGILAAPTIGRHVMAADGGSERLEAVITEVRPDGVLVLAFPQFAHSLRVAG